MRLQSCLFVAAMLFGCDRTPAGGQGDSDPGSGDGAPTGGNQQMGQGSTSGWTHTSGGSMGDRGSNGGNSGSHDDHGTMAGGANQGGNNSGGNTAGGNTSGGNTSGGNTSGGNTTGGNTSGGNTSGGDTSGGNTSGGDGCSCGCPGGGSNNPPPGGNTGGSNCTLTKGYWKNHDGWPVDSLTLGGQSYDATQLEAILQMSGGGLVQLFQQLIAAELNIQAGADGSAIAAVIAQVDTLIQGLDPAVDELDPAVASPFITALTDFNEGTTGPGLCQ
jgi:hypothetical protein